MSFWTRSLNSKADMFITHLSPQEMPVHHWEHHIQLALLWAPCYHIQWSIRWELEKHNIVMPAFLPEALSLHNYISEFLESLAQHFKITFIYSTSAPIVFQMKMDCTTCVSKAVQINTYSYYINGILERDF